MWVVALAVGIYGQDDSKQKGADETGAEFTASKPIVSPGETVLLRITLKLAEGAHANSNAPSDPLLIPTTFTPKKNEFVEWGAIEYPEPTEAIASYSPTPLQVFENGSEIKVPVKISSKIALDRFAVEGSLRIQVCDDEQCYPPKRIPLSLELKVKKGSSPRP